jgi:hypothetical protein
MLAVTLQSPGLVAYSVCFQPEIGAQTLLPTLGFELVSSICGSVYGPHSPCAALVVQLPVGVGVGVDVVGDGLGEVGVGVGVGLLEVGVGLADAEAELLGAGVDAVGVAVGFGVCLWCRFASWV